MTINHNISLKSLHTFSVEANCREMIILENKAEAEELARSGKMQQPVLFLGGGSNLLFTQDFEGTIIQLQNKGIEVVEETPETITLTIAAGELWEDLIAYCLKNEYYGIENLAGIPGWVGSAPVQNIGAYGVEVGDVIKEVETVDMRIGKTACYSKAECEFGYRSSIFKTKFKNQLLITSVTLQLSKNEEYRLQYSGLKDELERQPEPLSLQKVVNAVISLRNSKLPDVNKIGSAGSFFKNPIIPQSQLKELLTQYPDIVYYPVNENSVKLAAGKLIDLCGWKGKREGDAGVYPKQALVIVNYGQASGKEIVDFYQKIQQDVRDTFGVEIVPEVNIY